MQPDRYRIGPRGELQEAIPARDGAVLLDEPRARQLAELVASIADEAEAPQDVEWSFDGRDFHVLQSRPITALAGRHVYSRRMVSDMAPGVVKPLVWSAKYAPINENVFAPIFERVIGTGTVDAAAISGRFYSRVYVNVTTVGGILTRIGLPPDFFDMLAREDRAAHRKFRPNARTLIAALRLGRFVRRESGIDRRVQPFLESQQRELAAFRDLDWTVQPPEDLVAGFSRLKALHGRSQWHIVLVSLNMHARNRMLGRMITRRWPDVDPRDVIKGYGRRSTLAAFDEIEKLADQARSLDRDVLEQLASGSADGIAEALAASDRGRRLLDDFRRFMDRHGFLSSSGSVFSEPPWVETPQIVWHTVARLAGVPAAAAPGGAEASREETLGRLRGGLGPLRRRLFDHLHGSTVRYMECRERLSVLMTEETYLMRRCLLALGQHLARRRVLDQAGDVFFLFDAELEAVLRDPAEAAAARSRVAVRTIEFAEHAAMDPPEVFCGGQLSHTSIIAREFGIPAIVSVRHATRLIAEGQHITIDGTAGRVYLHPEPDRGGSCS